MNFPRYHPERLLAFSWPAGRIPHWSALLYLGMALLVLVLLAISRGAAIPFGVFTQDPMALAKGEPYFGLLSNLGILFWCATATLCLFVSSLIEDKAPPARRFFAMSGLFTLLLLLDDLFQLHEYVLPRFFGIRQRYMLLLYLLIALLYLVSYRKIIMQRYPVIMAAALALFGLSLAEDVLTLAPERWHYLLEDGAKLFGIVSWFNYFSLVCCEEVKRCIVRSPG